VRSTRRLPVPAGAAVGVFALALLSLGACTAGGSHAGPAADNKSVSVDGVTSSPLPPGKYRTLPQPCVSVDLSTLKKLVPDATDYEGTESLTYDTDRRVGCSWKAAGSDGTSRKLSVDVERVVSYDPGISDEVQAQFDFDQKSAAAAIPGRPAGTATTTPPQTPSGTPTGNGTATGTAAPTGGSTTGTGSDANGNAADYAPRQLSDVGDAAFINDVLTPPAHPATSATGPRRDVTLVFRTANVVVSITYAQSAPRGGNDPQSADLQKGAQQVADQLERKIER
jgi:hypothetical protein